MKIGYLPWHRTDDSAERPCLSDGAGTLTRREFGSRVEALAEQFRDQGVSRGDVVAVMLPNRVELVVALFAAWRLGAAATLVNPAFTPAEANHQITDSDARLVVNVDALAPDAGRPALHVRALRTTPEGDLPAAVTSGDELALVVYTFGARGLPKGVMLSHGNLEALARGLEERLEVGPEDHSLVILPLFRGGPVGVGVLTPMLAGAQVSLMDSFSPEAFVERVEQARPTYFSAVPAILAQLAAMPGAGGALSLRLAICAAAPVSTELRSRCEQRFGFTVIEGYGLAEAAGWTTCTPLTGASVTGSAGTALAGQHVRIVDGVGQDLPAGHVGEILLGGATVMHGYLGRAEETAEVLVDGWLHTGDLGRVDYDGNLTPVDGARDLVTRDGQGICLKDIESSLHDVDGVLEAVVVGRPDAGCGETLVAFVAPHPDAGETVDALLDRCRSRLSRVTIPVEVNIIGDVPDPASPTRDVRLA